VRQTPLRVPWDPRTEMREKKGSDKRKDEGWNQRRRRRKNLFAIQKVHQRKQFFEAVLQWGTSKKDTEDALEIIQLAEELGVLVFQALSLIHHNGFPGELCQGGLFHHQHLVGGDYDVGLDS